MWVVCFFSCGGFASKEILLKLHVQNPPQKLSNIDATTLILDDTSA